MRRALRDLTEIRATDSVNIARYCVQIRVPYATLAAPRHATQRRLVYWTTGQYARRLEDSIADTGHVHTAASVESRYQLQFHRQVLSCSSLEFKLIDVSSLTAY